jgi:membrane-associated phospholipid phosphatase
MRIKFKSKVKSQKSKVKIKTILIAFIMLVILSGLALAEDTFLNRIFFKDYETLGRTIVENPAQSMIVAGSTALAGWLIYENDKKIADEISNKTWLKDQIFGYANYGGDGVTVFALDSFLFLGGEREKKAAGLVMESVLVGGSIGYILKMIIGRERPSDTDDPYRYKFFTFSDMSMPSGHSLVAFSWAAVLGDTYGIGYITYPAAALCAIARVYRGAHWPSDVLLGSVLGTVTAKILLAARDKENNGLAAMEYKISGCGTPLLCFNIKI